MGEQEAARLRLGRLREGCATLGLAGAARALEAGAVQPSEPGVRDALAQAMDAVERQSHVLRQHSG